MYKPYSQYLISKILVHNAPILPHFPYFLDVPQRHKIIHLLNIIQTYFSPWLCRLSYTVLWIPIHWPAKSSVSFFSPSTSQYHLCFGVSTNVPPHLTAFAYQMWWWFHNISEVSYFIFPSSSLHSHSRQGLNPNKVFLIWALALCPLLSPETLESPVFYLASHRHCCQWLRWSHLSIL